MSRRPEWWQDVFNRPTFLELYQRADLERARTQVDQVLALLELQPPARMLDVCSGYGRHSVELARRGFAVTGVDISEMQVRQAVQQAATTGVRAGFIVGDARALPVRGPFDAAINMFLSFGYFATDAESQAMLDGISRVLRRGGRLLIDFWNREHEIRAFQPTVLDRRDDDILEIEDWSFDPLAGRLNWVNTVIFPDGRREAWTHSIRAFTVAEVRMMLEAAGFNLTGVYGSLAGEPYELDSEAAIFVAERV
ncbi:MAG: methyltransferase domain-containing protein [Armatimonadota bacterium]|nr:methyltransferase domain-containing protein [Armatimonadota bacterium]